MSHPKIVKNFLIQSETAAKIPRECPPGFVQFQDSCIHDESSNMTQEMWERLLERVKRERS